MFPRRKRPIRHGLSFPAVYLYRIPMQVTKVLKLDSGCTFPICPRCGISLEREYMNYCDRCGQCLGWNLFDLAGIVTGS